MFTSIEFFPPPDNCRKSYWGRKGMFTQSQAKYQSSERVQEVVLFEPLKRACVVLNHKVTALVVLCSRQRPQQLWYRLVSRWQNFYNQTAFIKVDFAILDTISFSDRKDIWVKKTFDCLFRIASLVWRFNGISIRIYSLGKGAIDRHGETS